MSSRYPVGVGKAPGCSEGPAGSPVLFERYPLLSKGLPYVSLACLPTPVERLEVLGKKLHVSELYVKRDDLAGLAYGGNKPRKLEFLLADALRSGATHVMTFGAAGSNHALATALYARQLGLKCVSVLMPQPNAHYVQKNLVWGQRVGAELHLAGVGLGRRDNMPRVYAVAIREMLRHRLADGSSPKVVPPGGSSPLGTIGFVNAAFELHEQIRTGEMPEPDYVYVAAGTVGTAAGLALGLAAAGLKTRVVAVGVTAGGFATVRRLIDLAERTNGLLAGVAPSFPRVGLSPVDVEIRDGFCGSGYAVFTGEGMAAVALMREHEGIQLDGTYTGKTMAALVNDAAAGRLASKTVLFWNTLNSRPCPADTSNPDYHELPACFHRFFEQPVQPLDQDI